MSENTDTIAVLLAKVRRQDQAALRKLYELSSGRLLAISDRMLQDRAAAEDVLQEVFVSIWNKGLDLPELQGSGLAWLTTLVRNRSIDHMRKQKPDVPLEWQDEAGETHTHEVVDPNPNAAEALLERETEGQLNDCLSTLPTEARGAIELAYFKGLTHMELAEQLQRPLGTIKAWVRRGLMSLKTCMEAAA